MSHPEWEGLHSPDEPEREHRVSVTLTKRQIDAILVSIHTELLSSQARLDTLKSSLTPDNSVAIDEYDVVDAHVRALQESYALIAATDR